MADIRATHGVDPARTQHRRRTRRALRQRRSRTRSRPSSPTSSTMRWTGRARPSGSPGPASWSSPGRAISARAGVTLYRVVVGEVAAGRAHVRRGGRRHVRQPAGRALRCEIHCGACQPPRARPDERVTVAGRHCESGDELARDVELPADIHPGDLLAVACTGAYQHSMASNYNMVGRPPIVAVRHGRSPRAGTPRDDWPICSRATAVGQAASAASRLARRSVRPRRSPDRPVRTPAPPSWPSAR